MGASRAATPGRRPRGGAQPAPPGGHLQGGGDVEDTRPPLLLPAHMRRVGSSRSMPAVRAARAWRSDNKSDEAQEVRARRPDRPRRPGASAPVTGARPHPPRGVGLARHPDICQDVTPDMSVSPGHVGPGAGGRSPAPGSTVLLAPRGPCPAPPGAPPRPARRCTGCPGARPETFCLQPLSGTQSPESKLAGLHNPPLPPAPGGSA